MSHFTVMVCIPAGGETDLEKILMPFYEVGCSEGRDAAAAGAGYVAFKDRTDEVTEDWETGGSPRVRMPDGEVCMMHDPRFYEKEEDAAPWVRGKGPTYPEGAYTFTLPYKEEYESLAEFAQDFHGYVEHPDQPGRFGYWHNPNAKWDWYLLGGRWTGVLPLKEGAAGESGKPGLGAVVNRDEARADRAKVKDVDWDKMRTGQLESKLRTYDAFQVALNAWAEDQGRAPLTEYPVSTGEELKALPESERNALHALDVQLRERDVFLFSYSEYPPFFLSRDEYIALFELEALTWAMITPQGIWIEEGEMGWWGMYSKDESHANYDKVWWQEVMALPPDSEVAVVDCHI